MIQFALVFLLGNLKSFSCDVTNDLHDLQVQPKFMTPCTTPNKDVGVCIEIQNCPIFMEAITSGLFHSYEFIRSSGCGPINQDRRHPKVCCGQFNNYLEPITTTQPPRTSSQASNTSTVHVLPKTCRTKLDRVRIMGGSEARLGEFPWMARLRHCRSDGLHSYGCSGFLISEKFILTAAHCIRSKILQPLGSICQVVLGEHNADTDSDCSMGKCADPPQFLDAAEAIVHSGYTGDKQQYNDIAVIPLKDSAKLTEYVSPICLPSVLSQIENMKVSGWGKTESANYSPIKLKVSLPRTNQINCIEKYRTIGMKLQTSQLCAGGEAGRDSCTGDSGGPLMVQDPIRGWFAEGIVSFGIGCGLDQWPGVYTSIPYYLPWIESVINQYSDNKKEESGNSVTGMKDDQFVWSTL